MADSIKYVKLKRSETCGFGFSILGGAGSELPPIIYDIIEGSPAANSRQLAPGDIIWEVNGQEVVTFTTKEVLNCLRLSSSEVTLKLKTDGGVQERVKQYLATPHNPEVLRAAITQDDLQGVKHIKAKKSSRTPPEPSSWTPPSLPSPTLSDASDRCSLDRDVDLQAENGLREGLARECHSNGSAPPPSEAYLMTEEDGGGRTARTPTTASPPLSEDESDIDSLHSFHYSPKAVDIPSAVRLAKRLISLDGFKKTDVSRHLSKNNEFSRAVAEEYLNYFDFRGDSLDSALRKFLDKFCLAGETQERERVLVHFSGRYLDCNPGTFNSQDAVHTLTCALMLLNTDLHGQNVGRKMTCGEFIDNLADLNDGENFPREVLKSLYHAMRNHPLQWAKDEEGDGDGAGSTGSGSGKGGGGGGETQVAVGSNPFLTPPSGSGTQYKKGYIMRKCCTDPNGKKTAFGKRSWKMWFCVIQDLVLYLHKDEQGARRGPQHAQMGHNAIRLHHALATRAHDYAKKEHVFRLQTADQAEYLLQTSDSKELQAWIDTINQVAAGLSAAPLPGAVGSQRRFQRPLLPCTITKFNMTEQLEDHTQRLAQLEQELEEHQAHPPDRSTRAPSLSNYKEKEAYLGKEVKRYRTYVYLLRSRLVTQPPPGIDPPQDLPVFEARTAGEGTEAGERGARVVPPPIPERARPGDSPPLSAKCAHDPILPGMLTTSQENKENGTDEDGKSEKGTLKRKSKEEKEKRKLEKQREKFVKEVEKKEREVEKKEKAREKKEMDLQKKEEEIERKDQDKQEQKQLIDDKKAKENDKQKNTDESDEDNEKKVEESKRANFSGEEEKKIDECKKSMPSKGKEENDDPGVGTLNRLSALFKFNRLNRRTGKEGEEGEGKGKGQIEASAPPLPPKPLPDSPIMKNVGTRLNI